MGETGLLFSKSSLHNGLKYKTRDHGESGPAFGGWGGTESPHRMHTRPLAAHTTVLLSGNPSGF